MDGLDPCIGVGFLIKNPDDLKSFEKAFKNEGVLSKIATIYNEKPNQNSHRLEDIDISGLEDVFL